MAKNRLLIERLDEYRTALITRTVTRGLPPEAARAAGLDPSPRLKPSGVAMAGRRAGALGGQPASGGGTAIDVRDTSTMRQGGDEPDGWKRHHLSGSLYLRNVDGQNKNAINFARPA